MTVEKPIPVSDTFDATPSDPTLTSDWPIHFTAASLIEAPRQPLVVEGLGLIVTSDPAGVRLFHANAPGVAVWGKLPFIPTTNLRGWAYSAGLLYVLDGFTLTGWELLEGKAAGSQQLATPGADAQQALATWRGARQAAEWAELLAETETACTRLATQPGGVPARLATMRTALRGLVGVPAPADDAAAEAHIASLRQALVAAAAAAQPWLLSSPVVKRVLLDDSQNGIFLVQGDGTIHVCDKALSGHLTRRFATSAEPHAALLEDQADVESGLLAYVSGGALHAIDTKTLVELTPWAAPDSGATSIAKEPIQAGNGCFWWTTSAGVYRVEASGTALRAVGAALAPGWDTLQVTKINGEAWTALDPNAVLSTWNMPGWIAAQIPQGQPVPDGPLANVVLSDVNGIYGSPPEGKSYLVSGPFATRRPGVAWSSARLKRGDTPLALLQDDHGLTALCAPSQGLPDRVLPLWSTAPWLGAISAGSALASALAAPIPAVTLRQSQSPDWLGEIWDELGVFANNAMSPVKDVDYLEWYLSLYLRYAYPPPGSPEGNRALRYLLWHALLNRPFPEDPNPAVQWTLGVAQALLNDLTEDLPESVDTLRARFGQPGQTWDVGPGVPVARGDVPFAQIPVPILPDPCWQWTKGPDPGLFHGGVPPWFDPWGFVRPGDFAPTTPFPLSLFDPLSFTTNPPFPQRRAPYVPPGGTPVFAVFTNGDPNLVNAEGDAVQVTPADGALVVTIDENEGRCDFDLWPTTPARQLYDAATSAVESPARHVGHVAQPVVAPPTVFCDSTSHVAIACTLVANQFATARLESLATPDQTGKSPFDVFVASLGGKPLDLTSAALPAAAMPEIRMQAFSLAPQVSQVGQRALGAPQAAEKLVPVWTVPSAYGALQVAPVIAGNRLLCTSAASIFALDLYTGVELRPGGQPLYTLSGAFGEAPPSPISTGGCAFFVDGGQLLALRLSDGAPLEGWTSPAVGSLVSVQIADGVAVVCDIDSQSNAARVTGYTLPTGAVQWGPLPLAQLTPGPVGPASDCVLTVSGGVLYAVNTRTGAQRFTFDPTKTPTPPVGPQAPLTQLHAPVFAPIDAHGLVVCLGAQVFGVDAVNGAQRWVHPAPAAGGTWLAPLVDAENDRVVVASSCGEVTGLKLSTGEVLWTQKRPACALAVMGAGHAYLCADPSTGGLEALSVDSGLTAAQYLIAPNETVRVLQVGAGVVFAITDTSVYAYPIGQQNAALFDTATARIAIQSDGSQLDLGAGDFTVEAWVRTTEGGEVISGFPTLGGAQHHGFRVNLADDAVRFAITNGDSTNAYAAQTEACGVMDGDWHHVAVVRADDVVSIYVDGIARSANDRRTGSAPLLIGGDARLVIGAFIPGDDSTQEATLRGLLRDVRLWGVALSAAHVESHRTRLLTGLEPRLIGYWQLNDSEPATIQDLVPGHTWKAIPGNVSMFASDLMLDDSAYPYLIPTSAQLEVQWPAGGHFSLRGDGTISSTPALAGAVTTCFQVPVALYGVRRSDGARVWEVPTPRGASAPVAFGSTIYALTGDQGVVAISADTGACVALSRFSGLFATQPAANVRLSAPTTDGRYLAAASPAGAVWVIDQQAVQLADGSAPPPWAVTLPVGPGDLTIVDGRVYAIAGGTLYCLDPATESVQSAPTAAAAIAGESGRIVFSQGSSIISCAGGALGSALATWAVPNGAQVTALATDATRNLVLVATATGDVYGLAFATLGLRWSALVPSSPRRTASAIVGLALAGRDVVVTTASGVIAALDGSALGPTAPLRALVWTDNPITTAPAVDGGTVYFGCAEGAATASSLDGALHSIVLGDTHALRLGLDDREAPTNAGDFVSVANGQLLELLDPVSFCVEAWINTRSGGPILSIAPTAASRFGLDLSVGADGALHFTCADEPESGSSWERFTADTGATNACNGQWHHVAISKDAADLVVSLDGVAQTATVQQAATPAPTLTTTFAAYLGAASGTPAAGATFVGFLGEIRVWDTFLPPQQLVERMHEKLTGNEPDLIAWWGFDNLGVHDGGPGEHDGTLQPAQHTGTFWLVDLPFTRPTSPYITTTATLVQAADPTATPPLPAKYTLQITARGADGHALKGTKLGVWYPQHDGANGPSSVEVSAPSGVKTLSPVPTWQETDANGFSATTDANGQALLTFTSSDGTIGPSLDVWADFLPVNERYHLSVLIDTQALQAAAPPRLEASSALIQDYAWSPGDTIDDSSDRTTYRTVIRCRNADGTARPGETLQLFAHDASEIEVANQTYSINTQNSATFHADASGELTVVIAAESLSVPELSIWAGFMHRNDRFTVVIGQDAQKKLSKVTGTQLSNAQPTAWSPSGPKTQTLVSDDYAPKSDDIAASVRQVAAAAPAAGPSATPATLKAPVSPRRTRLLAARAAIPTNAAMLQIARTGSVDAASTLRTMSHLRVTAPADPRNFRTALTALAAVNPAFQGAKGFTFGPTGTNGALEFTPLHAAPTRTPAPQVTHAHRLGSIFGSLWDGLKDAASDAWGAIKSVAVWVEDKVKAVVSYALQVAEEYIPGFREAMGLLEKLFSLIEVAIEKLILFLRLFFDFKGILAAQRVLFDSVSNSTKQVQALVRSFSGDLVTALTTLLSQSAPASLTVPASLSGSSISGAQANNSTADIGAHFNTVHGRYVSSKTQDHGADLSSTATGPTPSPVIPTISTMPDTAALTTSLSGAFGGLAGNPFGGSIDDLVNAVKALFSGDAAGVLSVLESIALSTFEGAVDALGAVLDCLAAEISIPFLSELWEWVTGRPLSILDLACLGLAIPIHIGYGLWTLATTGNASEYADDAAVFAPALLALPDDMFGSQNARLTTATTSRLGGPSNLKYYNSSAADWTYFAFQLVASGTDGWVRVVKGGKFAAGLSDQSTSWLEWVLYSTNVISNVAARSVFFWGAFLPWARIMTEDLANEIRDSTGAQQVEYQRESDAVQTEQSYQVAFLAISYFVAILACPDMKFPVGPQIRPAGAPLPPMSNEDILKDLARCLAALGGAALIGVRIERMSIGSVSDCLFATRDLLAAVPVVLSFDRTRYLARTNLDLVKNCAAAEVVTGILSATFHIGGAYASKDGK